MQLFLLNAALLGGLVAAALPTLIHLLSRRRARRVRFAPVELLLRSQKRTARSIRLQQLLLLLLRTLIIAAVAFAVTRPILRDEPVPLATDAPLVVVVAIDVSASMRARLDGRTAFTRAQGKALDVIRETSDDVRVGVVACDAPPRDLVAAGFDRRAVLNAVEDLEPGFAHSDLEKCLARAVSMAGVVEGEGERRVLVLSDLAAHAFPTGNAIAADGRGIHIEWVRAFDEPPPPNHTISAVDGERDGENLRITFRAARFGGPPVEVPADLVVDGRRTARITLPFSPPRELERVFSAPLDDKASTAPKQDEPGAVAQPLGGGAPIARQALLILEDDALREDNEVSLPLEVQRALRVLIVDGEQEAIPFRDEVYYLTQALKQANARRARVQIDVIGSDELSAARILEARVIVLANVARIEGAVAQALADHVEAGAGLFITMGDQVDVEAYNAQLEALLPAVLRGQKGQALLDDASIADVLGFTRFSTDHPVFQAFASDGAEALPGLSRVRTHTIMLVEPDARTQRRVLARFTNDAPALLERAVGAEGQGRVLLLATTIDRDWSDLAIRPGFLPLMQQIVLYLGAAVDETASRAIRVGAPRELRLPQGSTGAVVIGPDAQAPFFPVGEGQVVRFVDTVRPGLYRVLSRNKAGDDVDLPALRFTVLIDPRESDLTAAPAELLSATAPKGAVLRGLDDDEPGVPLWPWLLAAAVLLLALESAMLLRGSRTQG